MESQALRRLEASVRQLIEEHRRARERADQLSAALAKSREDLEKLKAENHRFKAQRTETRKRLDALIKRCDGLGVDASGSDS